MKLYDKTGRHRQENDSSSKEIDRMTNSPHKEAFLKRSGGNSSDKTRYRKITNN